MKGGLIKSLFGTKDPPTKCGGKEPPKNEVSSPYRRWFGPCLNFHIKLWGVGSLLLKAGLSTSWHPVSCIWDPPQSTGLNFLQSLNCVSKSFICKIFVLLILWQLSHSFLPSTDIKHLLCIFYISTKRSFYFLHYRDFVFCKNLVSASEAKFWNKVVTFNQTFVLGATSEGNGPGQW